MNRLILTAAVATLALGASGIANADMTYQGAVGLPLNPTASIPGEGTWRVQFDAADLGSIQSSNGVNTATFDVQQYGLHAAGSFANQFEVSAGFRVLRGDLTITGPGGGSGSD